MNPTEFRTLLTDDSRTLGAQEFVHCCEAGRIEIADIDRREVKDYRYEERTVTRILLYLKSRSVPIMLPVVAWRDLKAIMEKRANVVAFEVTKSGDGKNTRYQVIAETGVAA